MTFHVFCSFTSFDGDDNEKEKLYTPSGTIICCCLNPNLFNNLSMKDGGCSFAVIL